MKISETQQKILKVGKREFLEKGFKDASLRKIVAEAGFRKASIGPPSPGSVSALKLILPP